MVAINVIYRWLEQSCCNNFDAFQTEIQCTLAKLCALKVLRVAKVAKLPIMSPGAENTSYLNNP